MTFNILTDSTADLDEKWAQENKVNIVRWTIPRAVVFCGLATTRMRTAVSLMRTRTMHLRTRTRTTGRG